MKNREIKFRVWLTELKKFATSDEWLIDLNGNLRWLDYSHGNGDNSSDSIYNLVNKNYYTIQQFTCLKDKNGKEIYEGDILSVKQNDDNFLKGKIEYNEDDACFVFVNLTDNKQYGLRYEVNFESMIIGNVFENPELTTN